MLTLKRFSNTVSDEQKRKDCFTLLNIMRKIMRCEPGMWGASMIGFASYHYRYASGHEGDIFMAGFSPGEQYLVLYIMPGFEEYAPLLTTLGKYKAGKGCLYIRRLDQVDLPTLRELIRQSVAHLKAMYPQDN